MARVIQCPKCRELITDDLRLPAGHRAFFAFLSHAFDSWPEEHAFHATNAEHLRAWVLVSLGHIDPPMTWTIANERERKTLMPFVTSLMAHEMRSGRYCWVQENGGKIEIVHPVSLAWKTMGQAKFAKISNDVAAFIKEVAGIDMDEWLKHIDQKVPQ